MEVVLLEVADSNNGSGGSLSGSSIYTMMVAVVEVVVEMVAVVLVSLGV